MGTPVGKFEGYRLKVAPIIKDLAGLWNVSVCNHKVNENQGIKDLRVWPEFRELCIFLLNLAW